MLYGLKVTVHMEMWETKWVIGILHFDMIFRGLETFSDVEINHNLYANKIAANAHLNLLQW